jgi:putative restriction endonuclease
MRCWWVNHNQTADEEIEGRYLWSPKREANGARSEFYNNMRRAGPGDTVLSYSAQKLRYVGRVTEFAFAAPKPAEFGSKGMNWNQDGWLLPVHWVPLDPPIGPREILGELAPHLPARYSPINPETGFGNQKAYLAEIDHAILEAVERHTTFDRQVLKDAGGNSLTFESVREVLEDSAEHQIVAAADLDDTTRTAVLQARRGQGKFRQNVEQLEPACRLTGVRNAALLIASHIKPWRLCTTAYERLDGLNGLLLTPDADHLFDRGYVTFQNDGDVMVSPRVDGQDLVRLGLGSNAPPTSDLSEGPPSWNVGAFSESRWKYLEFHRQEIFIP